MNISINKQELIDFSKDLYKKSCAGYLDLEDSICLSHVERFFDLHCSKKDFKETKSIDYLPSNSQFSWGDSPIVPTSSLTYTSDVSFNPNYLSTNPLFPVNTIHFSDDVRRSNFSLTNSPISVNTTNLNYP